MDKNRQTLPLSVQDFLSLLNHEIKTLLSDAYLGCYLHGSLALGGFNPQKSDIDLLISRIVKLSETNKKVIYVTLKL